MATQSAYRNWIGVAPVTTTTLLATAAASAATSVKVVSATGITTASTIVILDGWKTETKAVSAVSTATLTVSALAHTHSKGVYVFALPTTGFGPKDFVPMESFKVPDKVDQLYDTGRVGSLVVQRGVVQGMRESEWTFGGDVYPDTFGFLLASVFGTDVYTAGSTVPHTHAFSVKNTGTGQPVKHAWWVYDGVNVRVVVGLVTKLGIKFSGKAPVSYTGTFMARASGVTSTPTASFSSVSLLAAWRATLTIATTFTRTPLDFSVTFTREEAENIPTMNGTQDPFNTYVGALTVKVKGTYVKTADTQLTAYLKGTTQKFVLTIAPFAATDTTGTGLTFQSSVANYDEVEPVLQGKAYNTETFAFTCIGNTSDHGTSGGLSPCKVSLRNAIATTVYL